MLFLNIWKWDKQKIVLGVFRFVSMLFNVIIFWFEWGDIWGDICGDIWGLCVCSFVIFETFIAIKRVIWVFGFVNILF